jgi:hypothetical protein
MLLLFISASTAIAAENLVPYKNDSSNVESYELTPTNTKIYVKFKDTQTVYQYPRTIFGQETVDEMARLAQKGEGLEEYISNLRLKPRLEVLPKQIICGPEGGYPEDEIHFPVIDRDQAAAALSYAHWAPDPDGIRRCVCEHFDFPSCKKLKEK